MDLIPASRFSLEHLTDIYNATRTDYVVPMPMSVRRMQEYIAVYDINLEMSVIASLDDNSVGLCMIATRSDRAWLTRLGVLPDVRRKGCGQAMMEHCISLAQSRGITMFYLEVITGNQPAYRLFTSLDFHETRNLLILRRPPGPSPAMPDPATIEIRWMSEKEVLAAAQERTERPAWTNQTESLANAGSVKGLHVADKQSEASGWVCFEKSMIQLRRVMIESDPGHAAAPATSLLYYLHSYFPKLDTIAENVPSASPHLKAYLEHGYVESFSRIEMVLRLDRTGNSAD